MLDPIPYLDLDGRCRYLVDRGYAFDGVVDERVRDFLSYTNFHYFLGYARNFRKLVRSGGVQGSTALDRVVDIVQMDQRFSTMLFGAIRQVEWALRAALVESHCALHPSAGCFLERGHFIDVSIDGRPTSEVVKEQTLRIREPYVVDRFAQAGETKETTLRSLPIWAIVDGWSLGLLARVIMGTRSTNPEDRDAVLWKRVAGDFEVSNSMFDTQLTSLVVLRNQVAHHSRLWMRPTSSTPKVPKIYSKRGRAAQSKSMYVGALALASFMRRTGADVHFLEDLDRLIAEDALFGVGILEPIS